MKPSWGDIAKGQKGRKGPKEQFKSPFSPLRPFRLSTVLKPPATIWPSMEISSMESAARDIVRRLRAAGHVAYYAGGCVRDLLSGQPARDFDVATDARPEVVQKIFPRTYAVGAHFGVIVVLENGFQFEVATFRSDGAYMDGRHPVEVHFASAEEDAARRDFTSNGMFFDPEKEEVIDFIGGRGDLERRLIRAIGDPAQRFAEDRLRMLRAVR